MSRSSESPALRYEAEEQPPHLVSAALGFQVVLLIVAGIVLTPIIVLRAADSTHETMTWAVFAALLVSGLTTILQARPIGPIGAGYILFMGTSGAFIAVSTTAVREGGLPLLATLVALSALAQFAFSARLSLLRSFITPTVGGTIVMLIAVTVFPICFRMLTSVPEHIDPASVSGPVTAISTFVVVLVVSLFTSGRVRLWGPLIGIVVGTFVGAPLGLVDLTPVREAAWIGVPSMGWPGLDLSFDERLWGLLPAFVIVTIVGAVETYGDAIAIQRVSARTRRPLEFRSVQGAVAADGLGNFLSGLAGTLPNTTYSTSISVVEITGVAARRVGVYGGILLMALAFLPKISALLQAVPDAVAGAFIFVLLVLLFAHGIRLAAEQGLTYENGFVVCISFWLGVGFQNQLIFHDHLPLWARNLLDNGMTSGGIAAMLLTLLLSFRHRSHDRLRLEPSAASISDLYAFLTRVATKAGWDKAAIDRLHLAGEEALMFLVDKEEKRAKPSPIRLSVREEDGLLALEFAAGPGAENLENLVAEIEESERSVEEQAALRILGHLAVDLKHEQFHDRNYLAFRVESTPLG
ncbi:MAG TPA: solute carrier family 23 protein [Vicinamibacteria bacterium]|nr:solute carrier family 23 protein [Vicinamibacteria bacterium]